MTYQSFMKSTLTLLFGLLGCGAFAQSFQYSAESGIHYSTKPVLESEIFQLEDYLVSKNSDSKTFGSTMPVIDVRVVDPQMAIKVESDDKMPNLFFEKKRK
jgi:hypothetical protein